MSNDIPQSIRDEFRKEVMKFIEEYSTAGKIFSWYQGAVFGYKIRQKEEKGSLEKPPESLGRIIQPRQSKDK